MIKKQLAPLGNIRIERLLHLWFFGALCFLLVFGLTTASVYASTFFDDFSDGNTDGWLSAPQGTWYSLGNWRVSDGVLIEDAGRDHYKLLMEGHSLSNQSVETKILFHDNGYAGITIWHHDVNNWVDVLIFPGHNPNSLRVIERVDGVSQVYSLYPLTSAQNTWYKMRVDVNSATGELDIYLDNQLIKTHTVTTTNRVGLSGLNSGNAGGSFDDFSLTDMLSDSDLDGDGVLDEDDLCADTSVDTDKWKEGWRIGRWQVMDGEEGLGWYRNLPARRGVERVRWGHDMAYTHGCSGHQILEWERWNVGGQRKYGLSVGTLRLFHKKIASDNSKPEKPSPPKPPKMPSMPKFPEKPSRPKLPEKPSLSF